MQGRTRCVQLLMARTSNMARRISISEGPAWNLCIMWRNSPKSRSPVPSVSNSFTSRITSASVMDTPHAFITDFSSVEEMEPPPSSSAKSNWVLYSATSSSEKPSDFPMAIASL